MSMQQVPHTCRTGQASTTQLRQVRALCSLQGASSRTKQLSLPGIPLSLAGPSANLLLPGFSQQLWPCHRQQQLCRQQRSWQQRSHRRCVRIAAAFDPAASLGAAQVTTQQLASIQLNPVVGDLAEGLEAPIQLLYLLALLGFLAAGAYLVVRQVFVRRDLEEAAKVLGERIRSDSGNAEDFFELGVILLRKKLFTQATRNLEKAKKSWQGEEDELAKVHNALGFAYFNMEKSDLAVTEYKKAVQLQPGYVTAWNNLGNAYEKASKTKDAYDAYREALSYAPTNATAKQRSEALQAKLQQ